MTDPNETTIGSIIFTLILGVIPAIMILLVLFLMVLPMNERIDQLTDRMEYTPIDRFDKTPIESLEVGSTISGSFVLGSGSVGGEDVYIYYTKTPGGGYVRNRVPTQMTLLYMDENTSPYIISHYVETKRKHVQFVNSYDLHVPNGTVTKTFTVT
jgi:hypothetical protein